MKKQLRCVSMILMLAFSLSLWAAASPAAQVRYGGYAKKLWENGLLLGSDGSFHLDKPLTRAEGAVMLVRLMGKSAEATGGVFIHPFTDVPDWASPYVGYCYQKGFINGVSDTLYGSGSGMTAAQYLTLLLRVLGYQDGVDFTWETAADKALAVGLADNSSYQQFTTTDVFLRDDAVFVSYNALRQTLKGTSTLLKDTIVMPGQPEGAMPSYVATGPTGSEPGKITVERQYAEDGRLSGAVYYRDGELVASAVYGSDGTVYQSEAAGITWVLETGFEYLTYRSEPPGGTAPPVEASVKIEIPKTLRVGDSTYDMKLGTWRNDPEIIRFNHEPIVEFIIKEISSRNLVY
jgi:hypothetical protein